MDPTRIQELLDPFLSPRAAGPKDPANGQRLTANGALQSISTYIDLLIRWNARINLTAIRDPEEIVTRHFGESLFAARHLFPQANDQRRTVNDAFLRIQNFGKIAVVVERGGVVDVLQNAVHLFFVFAIQFVELNGNA